MSTRCAMRSWSLPLRQPEGDCGVCDDDGERHTWYASTSVARSKRSAPVGFRAVVTSEVCRGAVSRWPRHRSCRPADSRRHGHGASPLATTGAYTDADADPTEPGQHHRSLVPWRYASLSPPAQPRRPSPVPAACARSRERRPPRRAARARACLRANAARGAVSALRRPAAHARLLRCCELAPAQAPRHGVADGEVDGGDPANDDADHRWAGVALRNAHAWTNRVPTGGSQPNRVSPSDSPYRQRARARIARASWPRPAR